MKLRIVNQEALNAWLQVHGQDRGHDLVTIRGEAPQGATYDDGQPIVNPVNIAWIDTITGERFNIEYELEDAGDWMPGSVMDH